VLQLVRLERRQLGPGGRRLRALLELGAKLAAGERRTSTKADLAGVETMLQLL